MSEGMNNPRHSSYKQRVTPFVSITQIAPFIAYVNTECFIFFAPLLPLSSNQTSQKNNIKTV